MDRDTFRLLVTAIVACVVLWANSLIVDFHMKTDTDSIGRRVTALSGRITRLEQACELHE